MEGTGGSSVWNLDPFVGTYDMIWSQQANMMEFSNGIIGLPESVILDGERQVYKKLSDGKYQLNINRKDSKFNIVAEFELGKEVVKQLPKDQTLKYTQVMTDANTLQGTYEWDFGDHVASFTIINTFLPDASGFFNAVSVSKPKQLKAHAPFYRVKDGDTGAITLGPS